MNKVYIVNELCELEQDTYMNCHGAFIDRTEAYEFANRLYEQAIEDVGGEWCESDMKVWNDNNIITISIDETNLNVSEQKTRDKAANIIDHFECLLESHDITIPDKERTGAPEEARLFGNTYYYLEDSIIEELDRI